MKLSPTLTDEALARIIARQDWRWLAAYADGACYEVDDDGSERGWANAPTDGMSALSLLATALGRPNVTVKLHPGETARPFRRRVKEIDLATGEQSAPETRATVLALEIGPHTVYLALSPEGDILVTTDESEF